MPVCMLTVRSATKTLITMSGLLVVGSIRKKTKPLHFSTGIACAKLMPGTALPAECSTAI